MESGSVPTGPSELYLQLLKREISPEEYARQVKLRARRETRERPPTTGAQPEHADRRR